MLYMIIYKLGINLINEIQLNKDADAFKKIPDSCDDHTNSI